MMAHMVPLSMVSRHAPHMAYYHNRSSEGFPDWIKEFEPHKGQWFAVTYRTYA